MLELSFGIVNADIALLAVFNVEYANPFSCSSIKKSSNDVTEGSKGLISHSSQKVVHLLMYGSYCLCVLSDQERKMISAAFPEMPLCLIASLRPCMPSIAFDFSVDEEHCCGLRQEPRLVDQQMKKNVNHGCVFHTGTSRTPEAWFCSIFCRHVEIRLKGGKA